MNTSTLVQSQLLATKFYVPVAPGTLIVRPHLTALLDKSLKHPFTLVSAPAGFGKTTLLSAWVRSQEARHPLVAWVSLDEEDNDPQLFWTYVLSALQRHPPERFTALLMQLQSPQAPPLKYLLAELINLLVEGTDHFLLILDDYQVITEEQVHTTLAYLIEHLPPQLCIVLATRADPSLPLPLLRVRGQALEVRTEQLRCTIEETRAFLNEVMGIQLPEETVREVTTRTEGWLVGLQLLALSLPERTDAVTLLKEVSGDQRYILDYLTEEVLRRQPQDIQTFLLSTCILERLNGSLCDAVMNQANSQHILQRLEKANLFVVSLDSKREWYRYHALFAEALRYQLEQMDPDLVLTLHHRASLWYAQHDQTTQAILHAFCAKEPQWAADLIERKSLQLTGLARGASERELILLRGWVEQLPLEVIGLRPYLCLTCNRLLWEVASRTTLEGWLKAAEVTLNTSLTRRKLEDTSHSMHDAKAQLQQNLLGDIMAARALLQSFDENGEAVLSLCQQALALLSADNYYSRTIIAWAQLQAYYYSSVNNAEAAVQCGLQGISIAQVLGQSGLVFTAMCLAVRHIKQSGQLRKAYQLIQQTTQLGRKSGEHIIPEIGWPMIFQAELLREWNELDAACGIIEEAILLCQKSKMSTSLAYILLGYAVQLRVYLSCRDLQGARSALEQFERVGRSTNQPFYLRYRSVYTTVDQVRLWLACGKLDRATHWAEELDLGKRHGMPFAREREEVACARILLAKKQSGLALQRLEPVLERAIAGKRWGHVIEICLLQALAYHMHQEETQALDTLSEAIRLAEPEGYIRSFIDEGTPMETLLYRLRKRNRKHGSTPYLDTLLAAFQQESKAHEQARESTKMQPLPEPLSTRELEVLQLMARGASNQEIAQQLVIVIDTVKRHVSHIFSKLGVQNRVQAVKQARELGLLDEEP